MNSLERIEMIKALSEVPGRTAREMVSQEQDALFEGRSNGDVYTFARDCFVEAADVLGRVAAVEKINHAYRVSGAGRIALEVLARRAQKTGGS